MAGYECPLCGQDATHLGPHPQHPRKLIWHVDCATCGRYFITQEAVEDLRPEARSSPKRAMLSGVTRERSEQDNPLTLCSASHQPKGEEPIRVSISEILETMVPHSVEERIDRALKNLHRRGPHFGDSVTVDLATDYTLLFAKSPEAARFVLEEMVKCDLLQPDIIFHQYYGKYRLTTAGRKRVDEVRGAMLAPPVTETDASDLLSALNVEWKNAHGFRLFELASFQPLESLGGQCQNRKDYHTRALSLAELMENLNESAMREVLPADRASSISAGHTLTVLEAYVAFQGYPNGREAVTALRKVQRLRGLPPTHPADKGGARAIKQLKELGFSCPVPAQDWPRVWQVTLDLFSEGLQLLRVDVRECGARGASPTSS